MNGTYYLAFLRKVTVVASLAAIVAGCSESYPPKEGLYQRQVDGEVFDITPVRGALKPLRYKRGSFDYACTECHNDFASPRRQNPLQGEHADIDARFDHGMNTYCVNCHHQTDRNVYVDHDGSPIPSTEPARLCAKCHGPTYREWELGIHGRQNGSWERNSPNRTKLLCIQCHDPHQPAFPMMVPDPPTIVTRFDVGGAEESPHSPANESAKPRGETEHGR